MQKSRKYHIGTGDPAPQKHFGACTGSTPVGIYGQLIEWYRKGDIDFSAVTTFNLDEYIGLSPEHEQSYHYYMDDKFFSHVNIPKENIHIPSGTTADIEGECIRYEGEITRLGGVDLQLLGLGHTGHIGFNEPNASFDKMTHVVRLTETTVQANARFFEKPEDVSQKAITMGIKTIMQSKKILLAVSGADKAAILKACLTGAVTPSVPASILQMHPDVIVVADESALSMFPAGK